MPRDRRPILGLIPAAGRASRLGALPCSKEIFPVGLGPDGAPEPVCARLLRDYAAAGIDRTLVILRSEKWDIPRMLGDGAGHGLDLAYLTLERSRSVPETLARATAWIEGADVLLGFPDIWLEPERAAADLVEFHRRGDQAISLGLFPCDRPDKADMVETDADGWIKQIIIKKPDCPWRWTWCLGLWRPEFTDFLVRRVGERDRGTDSGSELFIGDVVREAIGAGLRARGLRFEGGSILDIGTPEDLTAAWRRSVEARPSS